MNAHLLLTKVGEWGILVMATLDCDGLFSIFLVIFSALS